MKKIEVYDIEAEAIEKICDDNDISVANFIEMLMDFAKECKTEYDLI